MPDIEPQSSLQTRTRSITLLTDFGTRDGYAAAMRGVIASIAPDITTHDATHGIEPGDIHGAAWALAAYATTFPPGTVHIAVVDPGVGSERRPIAARSNGQIFVGPDNGVFTRVLGEDAEVVELRERRYMREPISSTFHGRDVFAPVAAHLAMGLDLEQLGPRAVGIAKLDLPTPTHDQNKITGEVVHVDRFGNLITNITSSSVSQTEDTRARVQVGDAMMPLEKTYAGVASGEMLAYAGSAGMIEIGLRDGNAAAATGMKRGARVILYHTGAAE